MKRKNDHLKLVKKRTGQPGWKRGLRFIFRLAIIAALILLLRQGETYFRINDIRVEGTLELSFAEVITATGIQKGTSIFMLKEKAIAQRIQEQLPRVKKVELTRSLPDTVIVNIEERIPAGYVMTADGFWLIDRDAVCFAYLAEPVDNYPYITGIDRKLVIPGAPLDCRFRQEALQSFFAAWNGSSWLEIKQIDLADNYNLIIYTTEELEIWLGGGEEMEYKLKLVQQSIPHITVEAGTRLDVRSGNRLVVSSSAVVKEKEVEP